MNELPFMKFFVNDWVADRCVRAISLAARGLWIEMLVIMWTVATEGLSKGAGKGLGRGYLIQSNGSPVTVEQLARMVGSNIDEVKTLLAEMEDAGVFSRTDDGIIFNRRMVRDEELRRTRAAGGAAGGEFGTMGGRPKKTPSPTPSVTPSPTPSVTPSPTPSVTPSPTPSVTPSPTPSVRTSEFRGSELNTPPSPKGGAGPTSSLKPAKTRRVKADAEADPRFVRFWGVYPRKIDKPAAAKAFAKLDPDDCLLETIIAAAKKYAASEDCTREGGRFVKHPGPWLNARRWEDQGLVLSGTTAAIPIHAADNPGIALSKSGHRAPPMTFPEPAQPRGAA